MALIANVEVPNAYDDYAYIRTYTGDAKSISVRGGYSTADGGQGTFLLDITDSTSPDNGGTVLVDAKQRRWKRPVSTSVDFDWWVPNKTGTVDVLVQLQAAATVAAYYNVPLNMSAGIYGVTDEFVPPDGLILKGAGNTTPANPSVSTIIRWIGSVGSRKAVVRCSRAAVGATPSSDVVGVNIRGVVVDANNRTGCAVYFRRFLSGSSANDVTALNARVVGICIYQTWFTSFGSLVSSDNYGRGVCIGYPVFGEVDNLAVNAVYFERIRTWGNGRTRDFNPGVSSATRYSGAGIITRTNACSFGLIECQNNYGFGWIETSVRSANSFSSYSSQNNGITEGSNPGHAFLNTDDVGGYKSTCIDAVVVRSKGLFINEAETPVTIQNFTRQEDTSFSLFESTGAGFRFTGGTYDGPLEYQSQSTYANAVNCVQETILSADTTLNSTGTISGCSFPDVNASSTFIKVRITFLQAFPGGQFTLSNNGAAIAYYNEPARPAGTVVVKDLQVQGPGLVLGISATTVATAVRANVQVTVGRLPNGYLAKGPTRQR